MNKITLFFVGLVGTALSVSAQTSYPDQLYFVGNYDGDFHWGEYREFDNVGNGIYEIKNVSFQWENADDDSKGNDNQFKILPAANYDNILTFSGENHVLSLVDNSITLNGEYQSSADDFLIKNGIYNIVVDIPNNKLSVYPAKIYLIGNVQNWDLESGIEFDWVSTGVYSGIVTTNDSGFFGSFRFYAEKNWDSLKYGPASNGENTPVPLGFALDKIAVSSVEGTESDGGMYQFYNYPWGSRTYNISVDVINGNFRAEYSGDVAFPDKYFLLTSNTDGTPIPSEDAIELVNKGNGIYEGDFTPTSEKFKFRISDHNGRLQTGENTYIDISAQYGSYGAEAGDKQINIFSSDEETLYGNYNNWIVTTPASGTIHFTVDMSDVNNKKVNLSFKKNEIKTPDELYIVGGLDQSNWDPSTAIQLERTSDNIFQAKNVVFNLNDENSGFQLITGRNWTSDRFLPLNYTTQLSPDQDAEMAVYHVSDDSALQHNYDISRGIYNITADFNTGKVSVEPVEDCYIVDMSMKMSFWEGPINEALRPESSENANDIPFVFNQIRDNERYIYKIEVAENIDPIEYVSQAWIGGLVTYTHYTSKDGVITKDLIYTSNDATSDEWGRTFYFDAHSNNALVPLMTEFWCDNSRIETGLTVKAIYLRFNAADLNNPLHIFLSKDGGIDQYPIEQRPLNSDQYSIALTSGEVYSALQGTRSGRIEVPFTVHAPSEGGYVINLGKSVTTKDVEKFEFLVNGQSVNAKFDMIAANSLVGRTDGATGTIAGNLTFNQIILTVEGDNYDTYCLWLRNGTDEASAPESFNAHARNPKLKVWINNDASWDDMYNSSAKVTFAEGDVKYYEFEPVMKDGLRTNLYYLDLPEGITVHKANYNDGHYDQFNIIDQDGYDVSNPYQGSQFIYPGTWWCANPNLMDPNGSREFQGRRFKEVPTFPSRVDLSFNLTDEQAANGDEIKIYGITLFKIIGNVYDIYAEAERETNVYYVYAHTEPRTGSTLRAKCEQTAPIMLRIKNIDRVKSPEDFDTAVAAASTRPVLYSENYIDQYIPKYAAEFKQFNDPGFLKENYNYQLHLSEKELQSNTDLNYTLNSTTLRFYPGNANAFEFVDVTGSQRWSALGDQDQLRPNKWSNYYAGDFDQDHPLVVNRPDIEYFKAVLATNPDQVRYQIMSMEMSIDTKDSFRYSSTNDPEYKSEDKLIYPVTDVTTVLVWREGYTIDVELTFTDEKGQTYTKTVSFDKMPEDSALPTEDGFYKDGEAPFEANLGTFFTQPGVTITAEAKYYENGDKSKDPAYKTESGGHTTQQLPVPVLENLQAEAGEYDENGTYNANLTWETDDVDYPRHYEFYHYDLTGSDDKESVPADGINSVDCHHSSETTTSLTTENATTLDNGETNGDQKEVTIGYRGHALYHFAVPENGAAEFTDDISYAELPANFMQVNTWSHEGDQDDLDNHQFTTALFAKEVSTGVEEVAADNDAPVEYYNLQGVRVDNPANGIFIRRQGNKVEKVIVK